MSYATELAPLNVFWATVVLLGLFALLNVMGISDSATVALVIFVFHILTLACLVVIGAAAILSDPSVIAANWATPMAEWPTPRAGIWIALFFGFSAAMLGISGFESSANYIEEQRAGVFPKTLRNMWIAVALFNPLISLLSFGLLPMEEIAAHKEALLSEMGRRGAVTLGMPSNSLVARFVAGWISMDAVVVLSGAVLTSYVGVTGLVRRMSLDSCLPQLLLKTNRWRNTNHWIIVAFFFLCCSILFITAGRIEMLAGVYTLSFLSVMALFAAGNLLLKARQPKLARSTVAHRTTVFVALVGVLVALVGNVLIDPQYVRVFSMYFVVALCVVAIMFYRSSLLTAGLRTGLALGRLPLLRRLWPEQWLRLLLQSIQCRSILFFATAGTRDELRRVAEYVGRNEQIRILRLVWCYEDLAEIPADLADLQRDVDRDFPGLHIDLLLVRARLDATVVDALAKRLSVPLNYMFITPTTAASIEDLSTWGGVRIIV